MTSWGGPPSPSGGQPTPYGGQPTPYGGQPTPYGGQVSPHRPDPATGPGLGYDPFTTVMGAGTTSGSLPWQDVMRDLLALLALFGALGQQWDTDSTGAHHDLVLVVTVLAAVSVAIPYARRAGLVAKTVSTRALHRVRAFCAVPFILVALVYIGADAALPFTTSNDFFSGGVGNGLGVGLAGALLAASPRRFELAELDVAAQAKLARIGAGAVWAILTLRTIGTLISAWHLTFFSALPTDKDTPLYAVYLLVFAFFAPVTAGYLVAGLLRGAPGAPTALVAVGAWGAAWTVVGTAGTGGIDSVDATNGASFLGVGFLVALGALASSPALHARDGKLPGQFDRPRAALGALGVVGAGGVAVVVANALLDLAGKISGTGDESVNHYVLLGVCSALVAVLAVVGRVRLGGSRVGARGPVVGAAALAAVFAAILLVLRAQPAAHLEFDYGAKLARTGGVTVYLFPYDVLLLGLTLTVIGLLLGPVMAQGAVSGPTPMPNSLTHNPLGAAPIGDPFGADHPNARPPYQGGGPPAGPPPWGPNPFG